MFGRVREEGCVSNLIFYLNRSTNFKNSTKLNFIEQLEAHACNYIVLF